MKRCPECLFIYPESDELCDFDKTPLVAVNDAEIDAAHARATKPPRKRFPLFIGAAVVVVLGVIIGLAFFAVNKSRRQTVQASTEAAAAATPEMVQLPSPLPSPSVSPSPSPTPTPNESSPRVATSHSRTSVDPVSTSGPGMGSRRGGKPVILLTSGAKIDADEVWRTRDGYWYRKNGIVTLLKHSQVKAIASR